MRDPKQHARDALQGSIEKAGSQVRLAERLAAHTGRPIATAHIHYWLSSGAIPTDICVALCALDSDLKREDLRPADYWRHWPDLEAPKHKVPARKSSLKPKSRAREEKAEA